MKLQALLIAVAMVAGGSAYAASDSPSTADTATNPTAGAPHQHKTARHGKASHNTAHRGKMSHKAGHQAKASHHPMDASTHHMGANGHHMSTSSANPETDLSGRDRQSRVDDAYSKWKSNH